MIDEKGNLRCEGCGKVLGANLSGIVDIVCPHSKCHRFNRFEYYPDINTGGEATTTACFTREGLTSYVKCDSLR